MNRNANISNGARHHKTTVKNKKTYNTYCHRKIKNKDIYSRIGKPLGIFDKNGNEIHCGDKIRRQSDVGRVLWNNSYRCYQICLDYSMWYGTDEYDGNSYGKAIDVVMDNGDRMEMEIIE